jgi:nucleoside-diphosphate-sugar epimerase
MEKWRCTMAVKNILIIGGTGFIGSNLVKRCLKLNFNITVISLNNLVDITSRVEYIQIDLNDREELKVKLENRKFNYIVNCAGYINHDSFFLEGRKVIDTHFIGLLNLIEVINRDNLVKFINIGSSDEYGRNEAPQEESARENPFSPYSFSKVACTHFLQMLWEMNNFPSLTIRLFLTYGPGQSTNRLIPNTIISCLKGNTFSVSKGLQLRDFCYIDDVIDAILVSLDNLSTNGMVLNIGSGNAMKVFDVIELIRKKIGSGNPEYGKINYRPGENMKLYSNISLACKILGWKPQVEIERGLENSIEYYKTQINY